MSELIRPRGKLTVALADLQRRVSGQRVLVTPNALVTTGPGGTIQKPRATAQRTSAGTNVPRWA